MSAYRSQTVASWQTTKSGQQKLRNSNTACTSIAQTLTDGWIVCQLHTYTAGLRLVVRPSSAAAWPARDPGNFLMGIRILASCCETTRQQPARTTARLGISSSTQLCRAPKYAAGHLWLPDQAAISHSVFGCPGTAGWGDAVPGAGRLSVRAFLFWDRYTKNVRAFLSRIHSLLLGVYSSSLQSYGAGD